MESLIFEDSPTAQYLEGEGENNHEWASTKTTDEPTPQTETISFAPRGLPTHHQKTRRKPPHTLTLESPLAKGAVARIHNTCSTAVHSRLGGTENALFLEQFRYIIVASQLLNEHSNPKVYRRQMFPAPTGDGPPQWVKDRNFVPSRLGLFLTSATAFALAWSVRWLRNRTIVLHDSSQIWLFASAAFAITLTLYYYFRRQWLHYLRIQAIESASSLTTNAQDFDAAASAGITLIQEVELVSRGYNISNPLPPITRLEEVSQIKKCARLRRTIHRTLISMFSPYYRVYQSLKPFAATIDLDKYYDIYEISRTDLGDAELVANVEAAEIEEADTLQDLKVGLQKLHIVRKLVLCTLLALDADGSKSDFRRWSVAVEMMSTVSSLTARSLLNIDEVMGEEEDFTTPPTPKVPLTPGRERMRSQMRQLGNLSQGIRGLQAKMRLLRDESDEALKRSDEVLESSTNLLAQYDSIGADLEGLMQEWKEGRVALAMNLEKKDHKRSLSSTSNLPPVSPTFSLSGATAVGGSPQNALQAFNGFSKPPRSRSSTMTSSSSEEIFEAVALPRQRSTLTREERIAKTREERVRQTVVKEKANASTHMLKELETVIRLRPRGRTTGRLGII
ncbi:MAG: hypothetical protein ALECFALPRED_005438 [Alectoria fallacina]|uniref:Vezatin n=1 Tax=Alectoria fallacina TaxID=1903189 RepID=A0A8H3ES55_9LECA|nr:MAG: hypothetical protein ALECFALPRED_005438 [Alectoria fallacina]